MRTEQVTIDGVSFQLMPMPLLEARKWDAKILMILAPLLGALDALGSAPAKEADDLPMEALAAELVPEEGAEPQTAEQEQAAETPADFAKIAVCFQKALSALSDEVMSAMVRGMFARVSCIPVEGAPFPLNTDRAVDQALGDCGPLSIYKLMFEVAKFNKFTPFALAAVGGETGNILASLVPAAARKGLQLGRLAGSTP